MSLCDAFTASHCLQVVSLGPLDRAIVRDIGSLHSTDRQTTGPKTQQTILAHFFDVRTEEISINLVISVTH